MRKKVVCDSCKCIRDIPEFVFFFFFLRRSRQPIVFLESILVACRLRSCTHESP